MITIVTYTAEELVKLVQQKAYGDMPVIPISVQRAISISHSPRTKPEHVVMACAYQEDKLVGYLGLLPDSCLISGAIYPIGWLSSMWVSADQRGKGIAPQLINRLLEAWNHMVLTTNQSPAAATVFNRHPDFTMIPNDGIRYYIKSRLAHFIPQKKPRLTFLHGLLNIIDMVINNLSDAYEHITINQNEVHLETTQEITPELASFIQQHHTNSYCQRGVEEFEWMMKFPWIYQSIQPDNSAHQYEFTISTKDYKNEFILCYHHKKLVGLALVMLKKGELKISGVWCDSSHQHWLAKALHQYLHKQPVFEVTVFNNAHRELMEACNVLYLLKRKIARPIFACRKLQQLFQQEPNQFIDGDGDSCFA